MPGSRVVTLLNWAGIWPNWARGRWLWAVPGLPWHPMPVATMYLDLRMEHAHSLKDRRQVVRSLKEKLGHAFNISVAEMDEAVTWQSATLGIAAISGSRDYLSGLMAQVENAAVRIAEGLGAEVTVSWDFLESAAD